MSKGSTHRWNELAVSCEVIGAAAFVACRRTVGLYAGVPSSPTTEAASATTGWGWGRHCSCCWSGSVRGRAVALHLVSIRSAYLVNDNTYSQVTRLAARVAASASSAAAQTQSRAVSLYMAEALAVVALLRWIHLSAPPSSYTQGSQVCSRLLPDSGGP